MIHPIPADSWRNLIEQIGGYSSGGCASRGKCGLPVDSEGHPATEIPTLAFCEEASGRFCCLFLIYFY